MTSATFTIIISSALSTSVTVTPVAGLTAPVAAGTVVANIAVLPAGWTGGVTLSGANASSFAIGGTSPNYTIVAAAVLAAGSYSATVTVTP